MLFFDLESYVPKVDRNRGSLSFKSNPFLKGHRLIGGTFFTKKFDDVIPNTPRFTQHWLWNYEDSEKRLLEEIYALFQAEWKRSREDTKYILKKPVSDLVVCGIGVSRYDLTALLLRCTRYNIDSPEELYNVFLKCRPIDLSDVCTFLFPEERKLYPKTAKEIIGRLRISGGKDSSKSVWDMYDCKDYTSIENRTTVEVRQMLEVYKEVQQRLWAKAIYKYPLKTQGLQNKSRSSSCA
jgi:hypothetical protein